MLALNFLLFVVLQVFVFYLSRYRNKYSLAFNIFAVCNYLFLVSDFFLNDGLNGPSLLAFLASFLFLAAVSSIKLSRFWLVGHVVTAIVLSLIQYHFPQTVKPNFTSIANNYIDKNFTFIIVIIAALLVTNSIKSRYHQERNKVAAQNRLIGRKNRKLEFIDKERNRLFSIIAHDLRSPLTSINGYLELLTSGVLNNEERAEMEGHLLNLSTHTSEMLNNLLRWSKNQLEGNKLTLQTLNVANTLRNTIDIQKSIASNKEILLLVNIPENITFYADSDHIDVVVRNLLSNALKFTNSDGVVEIKAEKEKGNTIITIKDNGIGISEKQKPLIFTSEIKSMPGTQNEKGIGLGLVMCREFVTLQGGTISFESTEGKGTTFRIELRTEHQDVSVPA